MFTIIWLSSRGLRRYINTNYYLYFTHINIFILDSTYTYLLGSGFFEADRNIAHVSKNSLKSKLIYYKFSFVEP